MLTSLIVCVHTIMYMHTKTSSVHLKYIQLLHVNDISIKQLKNQYVGRKMTFKENIKQ